mgnify:FL=1|tara:strand:+ start:195 stop:488 length:294 start_codon:yes stop_codon:yes gene_type:complete
MTVVKDMFVNESGNLQIDDTEFDKTQLKEFWEYILKNEIILKPQQIHDVKIEKIIGQMQKNTDSHCFHNLKKDLDVNELNFENQITMLDDYEASKRF